MRETEGWGSKESKLTAEVSATWKRLAPVHRWFRRFNALAAHDAHPVVAHRLLNRSFHDGS